MYIQFAFITITITKRDSYGFHLFHMCDMQRAHKVVQILPNSGWNSIKNNEFTRVSINNEKYLWKYKMIIST